IRLPRSVISLTNKCSQDGVDCPGLLCAAALVEIARILMQERWQNGVAHQVFGSSVGEARPQPLAISLGQLGLPGACWTAAHPAKRAKKAGLVRSFEARWNFIFVLKGSG